MADDFDKKDDSIEILPVERRHAPRGDIPGLTVEVLEGPLAGQNLAVEDVGLESFFLAGEAASHCKPKEIHKLRLRYEGEVLDCQASCVRAENEERTGAVMLIEPGETAVRALFERLLKPAEVPPHAR